MDRVSGMKHEACHHGKLLPSPPLQEMLMYQRYMESFYNPPGSFQTARELWNQLDQETRREGSLVRDSAVDLYCYFLHSL